MKDVYQHYARSLSEMGVSYAILRTPRDWGSVSDLDVISDAPDLLGGALVELGFVETAKEDDHAWYVKYSAEAKAWIHFDVNRRLRFDKIIVPHSFVESILAEVPPNGIRQLNVSHEAVLLIFHAAVHKGQLSSEYLERITAVDRNEIENLTGQYSFLPEVVTYYYDLAQRAHSGEISPVKAVAAIRRSLGTMPFWSERVLARLALIARVPKAIFRPRIIAVVGCDGVGKSTVTNALATLPYPRMFRQYMGIDNPSQQSRAIRIIWRPLNCLLTRTRKTSPVGLIVRLAMMLVRYADFSLRILRNWYRYLGKRNLLLLDRYPCDVYFRKPELWSEFIFIRCFPRPWFTILLAGNPQAIHERKPELTTEEIEFTLNKYRKKLKKYKFTYHEINTTSNNPAESIQLATAEITRQLEGRMEKDFASTIQEDPG